MPDDGAAGSLRHDPSGFWYDLPDGLAIAAENGDEVVLQAAGAGGGAGEITLTLRRTPGIDPFAAGLDQAIGQVIGARLPQTAYEGLTLRKRSLYRGICYRGDARKRRADVAVTLYVVVLPGRFALAVYERPQGGDSRSQELLRLALSLRSTEAPPPPGDALARKTRDARLGSLARRKARSEYQTFLCHNSKDKPAVSRLSAALEAAGLVTWLDKKRISAGASFVVELETALRRMDAMVVALGPHGVGQWQALEYGSALSLYVDARAAQARPVALIPVILPGGPRPEDWPLFIRNFHGVDMRGGIGSAALELLVAGILGDPGFAANATARP